jgi:glycosyltransferase involved in cell wall biosynthesis
MSMPHQPLVSILTPTFNSARYLEELIRSVEGQEYSRIEHIVIDDGSQDGGATVDVLRRHPRVRWWSRENRGQYPTLNEALRAATGEFVTVISADDIYADAGAVGAMARFLLAHADVDVVHGRTRHLDAQGVPLAVQPYQRYAPWMVRYNLGCILHCSMLVRRQPLLRHGLFFDETLRYVGDADWLIRLYQANLRFARIDRDVGAYRHHSDQVSTLASADGAATESRLAERARLRARYPASPSVRALVGAYDTFQQRRLKAQAAWRRGGARRVLAVTADWWKRRHTGG